MSANEKRYHVVAINQKTQEKSYLTSSRVTHDEGCTIMRKFTHPPTTPRRIQLEEAPNPDHALACPECGSRGAHEFNEDKQDPTYLCASCRYTFDADTALKF